jgi:hypothetical protein
MVELQLLERRERAVACLHQLEQAVALGCHRADLVVVGDRLAQEGQCDDDRRDERDQRPEDQRGHARASESRVTSLRCSRASGHIATSEPKTNR